jgi:hypothetical protein
LQIDSGKCSKHEHFAQTYDYGNGCEPTCDDPQPESCSRSKNPGCFCNYNYIRDLNTKQCVLASTCNGIYSTF